MMRQTLLLPALFATAVAYSAGPNPPAKPPVKLPDAAPSGHCAVCGMLVANFPDWAAAISFKDGTQAWFDGPKDLFTGLLNLKRYAPRHRPEDITAIQVKDYYGLGLIDGRLAFYVLGSDVLGPMGRDLVPFATEAAARDFLKDHKGRRVLAFQDVTPALLKGLE